MGIWCTRTRAVVLSRHRRRSTRPTGRILLRPSRSPPPTRAPTSGRSSSRPTARWRRASSWARTPSSPSTTSSSSLEEKGQGRKERFKREESEEAPAEAGASLLQSRSRVPDRLVVYVEAQGRERDELAPVPVVELGSAVGRPACPPA